MKKVLLFTALAAALTASFAQANEKLVVAATPIPHAEILELVKPTLAKEGVDLEIKVFTDYVQPNTQVAEKRLDANYFQTLPYLENFNKGKGTNLVTVIGVHVEPIGGYSKKIKNISELKDGATVAIELKRRGDIDGVEQLTRYLELLNRDPLLAPVRGIFAAQQIKPQAKVLAKDRGIDCVTLDYDAMRGVDDSESRLF